MVRTDHFAGLLALISLNGISKLFSSFESNPRSLEASLKFLLVAASAFILNTISMFLREIHETRKIDVATLLFLPVYIAIRGRKKGNKERYLCHESRKDTQATSLVNVNKNILVKVW